MSVLGVRILVVEDCQQYRRFIYELLEKQPGYEIIAAASDGRMAVKNAEQLKPELVLLDIGLPWLNGMEATRQIRCVSPYSKILIVTENRNIAVARAAFRLGANGYLIKSDAQRQLLTAIEAVRSGKKFISDKMRQHQFGDEFEACGPVYPG